MKVKTSLTIEEHLYAQIKQIAAENNRSVSYILEQFIADRVSEDIKNYSPKVQEQVEPKQPEDINARLDRLEKLMERLAGERSPGKRPPKLATG